jgi:hypothetical protein
METRLQVSMETINRPPLWVSMEMNVDGSYTHRNPQGCELLRSASCDIRIHRRYRN